jgi:hypothetical protein
MVTIDPKDSLGCTFPNQDDGEHFLARVVHSVLEKEDNVKKDPQ